MKIKEIIKHPYFIEMICDWVILVILGIFLDLLVLKECRVFSCYYRCIPGITKDNNGNFICGSDRNPAYSNPLIEHSLTAVDAVYIAFAPFLFLIIFNTFVWSIKKYREKYFPSKNTKLHINQSFLIWLEVILRSMAYASAFTALFVHILKFTLGIPRPNANTLYDNNDKRGMSSFPSGHIAIGYTNCFLFALWCQNAIDYSMKHNYNLFKKEKEEQNGEREFNGHYWFLLPLWNKLSFCPTISIFLAWSPLIFASTYIGITRIKEYWHTDIDCVAGGLIGIFCAYYFAYKRFHKHIYGIRKKNINQNNDLV